MPFCPIYQLILLLLFVARILSYVMQRSKKHVFCCFMYTKLYYMRENNYLCRKKIFI